MKRIASLLGAAVIVTSSSFADINSLLDSMVYGAYSQNPGVIVSPTRTTYTLGSFSFRMRNDLLDQPVFSLQPPRATLSCSGADFDAGWLSIMNLSTFADLLQQAGTQFMWGVVVGLAYSLPGIATSFDYLQKWGRWAQQLAGNMCNIGTSVGKTLGESIFQSQKKDAAEAGVGGGDFSAFTEAFKSFQQFFDLAGFFGAYPVDALEQAGWMDQDIRDLIATATGILVWFPMDKDGNICTETSCIKSGGNVQIYFYEPNPEVLREILYGGTVEVYGCDYEVYAGGWGTCKNGLVTTRQINTDGLITRVYENLISVRESILSGSWSGDVDSNSRFVASMTLFFPQINKVLNASALLKKKGYTTLSNSVLYAYAELIATNMIYSLLTSMYDRLYAVKGLYMLNKKVPSEVSRSLAGINETIEKLREFLKVAREDVFRVEQAVKNALTIEAIVQEAALEKFGKSAAIFLRR